MGNWSDLPEEITGMILCRLPLISDQIRFGSVCLSWQSILTKNRRFLPRFPFLLMCNRNEVTTTQEFFSISCGKTYQFNLPEIYRKWCCGSSQGWLALFDNHYGEDVFLLNPFSRLKIPLPSLNTYDQNPRLNLVEKVVLSANPISNPDDYMVMGILDFSSKLILFKPGDENWTIINGEGRRFEDITYYKGRFHAINHDGIVVVCELSPKPRLIEIAPPVVETFIRHPLFFLYLLESSGELLQIIRHFMSTMNTTVGFQVLKLDHGTGEWVEIKSLGDQVIFLDAYGSISLPAKDLPDCKENCIYFTNGNSYEDAGIFNLGDGSIESLYHSLLSHVTPSPTIWLTPNPWRRESGHLFSFRGENSNHANLIQNLSLTGEEVIYCQICGELAHTAINCIHRYDTEYKGSDDLEAYEDPIEGEYIEDLTREGFDDPEAYEDPIDGEYIQDLPIEGFDDPEGYEDTILVEYIGDVPAEGFDDPEGYEDTIEVEYIGGVPVEGFDDPEGYEDTIEVEYVGDVPAEGFVDSEGYEDPIEVEHIGDVPAEAGFDDRGAREAYEGPNNGEYIEDLTGEGEYVK